LSSNPRTTKKKKEVKILDLLNGGMSLEEVGLFYEKNESNIRCTVLHSVLPEHLVFPQQQSL
jgi:hypothetical protein